MQVDFLDRYSRGTSVVHRLDARAKLISVLAYIVLVVATPELVSLFFGEAWAVWLFLGCEAWLVVTVYAFAELPWKYLVLRLAALLPFLLMIAVGIPLSHGFASGWNIAAQLVTRSLISLTVMITVVATTPFERLLTALARLGLPRVFLSIVAFMYRYMFVLWDELDKMRRAKLARTFYPSILWDFRVMANFVGILFVRAFERAERIYAAMLARGWRGDAADKDAAP